MTSNIVDSQWSHCSKIALTINEGQSSFSTLLDMDSLVELVEAADQHVPWLLSKTITEIVRKNAEAYFDEHEEVSDSELSAFIEMLERVMA